MYARAQCVLLFLVLVVNSTLFRILRSSMLLLKLPALMHSCIPMNLQWTKTVSWLKGYPHLGSWESVFGAYVLNAGRITMTTLKGLVWPADVVANEAETSCFRFLLHCTTQGSLQHTQNENFGFSSFLQVSVLSCLPGQCLSWSQLRQE